MGPGEPLLLICLEFPPVRGIGGRRWAKFAKELARRGHPVHVIRSAGHAGQLDSLWATDATAPRITHHPLPARYPRVLTTRPLTNLRERLLYNFWMRVLPMLAKGNWYDASIFWRRPLLALAAGLVKQHAIRHVVVSGAPFRLMAYAAELKALHPQIRLTLDFRDEWTWGGHYGLSTMDSRRMADEQALEAMAVSSAQRLTSPAPSIIAHLRNAYPGASAHLHVVPHAVDPDDIDRSVHRQPDGLFRMIYAGSMYGGPEAELYFTKLLQAVQFLRDHRPAAFESFRFDLYITGHGVQWYEQQVAARGWQEHIIFHEQVPPRTALGLIGNSDLVVLFIPGKNKDLLGTKFQEIFYAGTPILHVGEPGLVSRTVEEGRMGVSLRVEELASELPRILSRERKVECDRNADHSAYLLPSVTDRLISEVLV
ncbi:MAG: hypothetical protein M9900_01010 [Flavobacteriales bacterium]|nr:hypothetical protein [Flavobacteriales bacterium]